MGIIQSYFYVNIEGLTDNKIETKEVIKITVKNCNVNSFSIGELINAKAKDDRGMEIIFTKFPFLYMGSPFILKLPLLIVKRLKPPKRFINHKNNFLSRN